MASNICNVCGGEYILKNGRYVCPYCNAIKPIDATLEEENLLSNAWQKLRLANFDDAEESFTDIKNIYPDSHRAYWGLVLSKYGIKYEKDYDGRMIPSCYSTRYESFIKDDNYLKAIKLADKDNKEYYESQAEKIEKIRKEWVEKAQKEKPYDIFISYKDSDEENGIERTQDSFEAYEIYNHLEKLGYRVFYSRETLKNKSGEKYEPYIFNALNTAKVMIVYGSKLDYINSTWVKNEWLRFIKRIRDGEKQQNSIILTYKGINPSKLDPPLSKIQGLDRSSITFLTDLDAYCKRIIEASNKVLPKIKRAKIQKQEKQENNDTKKLEIKELNKTTHSQKEIDRKTIEKRVIGSIEVPKIPIDAENKLKVIFGYLENGYTDKAYKQLCLFLDDNPNNGKALYGKLLASCKSSNISEFEKIGINTFSDWQLLDLVLTYNREDSTRILKLFANQTISLMKNNDFDKAKDIFVQIYSYDNESITNLREQAYRLAVKNCSNNLEIAKFFFDSYINYENNSDNYINALKQITLFFIDNKDFDNAKKYYEEWERLTDFTYDVNMAYLFISHKTKILSKILDESIDNKNIDSVDFVIKRMDQASANKFIQNIIDDINKRISKKEYNNLTQIIKRYLVYDFDNREEKIRAMINNICKNPSESAYTTFETLLTLVDNSQEQYNEYFLFFAENAIKKKQFQLAEKLYGSVKTKQSQMYRLEINLGVTKDSSLEANIHKLKDFTIVENVLSLCETNDEQMGILDTLLLATIKNANKTTSKNIIEIFDKLITYIPDGYDLPLCGYLLSFANTCKKNKFFEDATRYYSAYLAYNNQKHEVYWYLLQVKLKCSSDEELTHQTIVVSEQIEFENALTIATNINDNSALKRYMNVEEKQNEYIEIINKKIALKKKKKKIATIASIAIAIVLVIAIIISGIIVGIKVEQNLKFSNNSTGVSVYAGKNFISSETLIIPSTYKDKQVTEIKAGAFKNHTEITKVIIPNRIISIDDEAFYGCSNLKTIEYSNDVAANNSYDNIETKLNLSNNNSGISLEIIGNRAFYNCVKLSDFEFNDGLKIIGNESFFACSSFTNIEIPTSVKNIGNCAFSKTNLNTISIPNSVEYMGDYIFKDCINLTNIYLSNMSSIPQTWDNGWNLGCNSTVNQTNTILLDYNNSSNFKGRREIIIGDFYSLPIPKRDGYTFDGWYIDSTKYTDSLGNSLYKWQNYSDNITFKAKWVYYTVSTTTNNNNAGNYTKYVENKISAGETITLKASTNDGYTWLGWYDGEAKVSEGTSLSYTFVMGKENKTYIAKWTYYTISTNTNLNNAGTYSIYDEQKITIGKSITLEASSNAGYTWLGWYEGETKVSEGDDLSYTFTMGEDNKIYTAKWIINKYKIVLVNQAEGVSILGIDSDDEYEYATNIVLNADNIPILKSLKWTRSDGYSFEGSSYEFTTPAIDLTIIVTIVNTLYTRKDDAIYFGTYPQTEVTDNSIISSLNSQAGFIPTKTISFNWTSYGYYITGTIVDYMWYIDLEYENEKYRGVRFSSYRPYYPNNTSSTSYSNQDENGYNTGTIYWFKYEPIKWSILHEEKGEILILADLILDSQQYDYGGSYSNNYANSTIRQWLNEIFYNTAFNDLQKQIILTTEVDNSERSTNPNNDAKYLNNGYNQYACSNTQDKLFLLSKQEITSSEYGFDTSTNISSNTRIKQGTDYAKSQGLSVYDNSNSSWWLRSPSYNSSCSACIVYYAGNISVYNNVHYTACGIVPTLRINLE